MSEETTMEPVRLDEVHWLVNGSSLNSYERRERAQRYAEDFKFIDADGFVSRSDADRIADLISWTDEEGVYRGFVASDAFARTTRPKYRLLPEDGLYRLISTGRMWGHKEGQRGGLVQSHLSLSHEGNCWVAEGARVLDTARVIGDAQLMGNAHMSGRSLLAGNAVAWDNVSIGDTAVIDGTARLRDEVRVYGSARVTHHALLGGHVMVDRDALVGFDTVLRAEQCIGAGAVLLQASDVLHLAGAATPWGAVTAYATKTGHVVRIGCQTMTVETLAERLAGNGNNTLAREMLPGFVAMLAPMIERWALSTDDRAELALRVRTIQD